MTSFILLLFLAAAAGLLAVPSGMFLIEVIAALVSSSRNVSEPQGRQRPRIAVLVPAHNESANILPTLNEIKRQLLTTDRLLVVADNCDDDTAAVASAGGAEVIIRNDKTRIGKGYALDFGVSHLGHDPPDVVIVIDADCRISDGTIGRLATDCFATQRPTQALNLSTPPAGAAINYRVAEFASRVKNLLRPRGLHALGLPCQLTGTGMAFPWDVIRKCDLASGSIVEDMKLGLDLAKLGYPPIFCEAAKVTSDFPSTLSGAKSQRERWETGHVKMILTAAPGFLLESIMRRNAALLALTLDLAIPPLSLYFGLIAILIFVTGAAAFFGLSPVPLIIALGALSMFGTALFAAWWTCARDILPPNASLLIIAFLLAKFPMYLRLVLNRTASQWIRADRRK